MKVRKQTSRNFF